MQSQAVSKELLPQLQFYVKTILKSGLLLDEDVPTLEAHFDFNFEDMEPKPFSLTYAIIGGLSVTGTICVIKKCKSSLLTAACASLFVFVATYQASKLIKRVNQRRNIEQIIANLRNFLKLNRLILDYLKQRKACSSSDTFTPYTKKVEELAFTVFQNEVLFLQTLRDDVIRFCTATVPSLRDEYIYLNDIDLKSFDIVSIKSIDDCISLHQRLCDVFLLIASNCLTCLGLTLCPNLWINNSPLNIYMIISEVVPKVRDLSLQCYQSINKKFHATKYNLSSSKGSQIKLRRVEDYTSSRLQSSLLSSMMHTSIILEKSQTIFEKLQQIDVKVSPDKAHLGKAIAELRDQAFNYYESLDILCKLYEVTLKPKQIENAPLCGVNDHNAPPPPPLLEDNELNLNEPLEDEEYELYIGESDVMLGASNFNYEDEEESHRFLSLVTQELKHSLKSHDKFLAARKKRGIIDEPVKDKNIKKSKSREFSESPSNDESALLNNSLKTNNLSSVPLMAPPPPPPPPPNLPLSNKPENTTLPSACVTTPPPPPPPPCPNLQDDVLEDTDNSFLASVQAAAAHRCILEDFFGDDADE